MRCTPAGTTWLETTVGVLVAGTLVGGMLVAVGTLVGGMLVADGTLVDGTLVADGTLVDGTLVADGTLVGGMLVAVGDIPAVGVGVFPFLGGVCGCTRATVRSWTTRSTRGSC
jgi:hypothetical protein